MAVQGPLWVRDAAATTESLLDLEGWDCAWYHFVKLEPDASPRHTKGVCRMSIEDPMAL